MNVSGIRIHSYIHFLKKCGTSISLLRRLDIGFKPLESRINLFTTLRKVVGRYGLRIGVLPLDTSRQKMDSAKLCP